MGGKGLHAVRETESAETGRAAGARSVHVAVAVKMAVSSLRQSGSGPFAGWWWSAEGGGGPSLAGRPEGCQPGCWFS
eukprot:5251150-Heterocapsa_arctica.AAC.1